MSSRETALLNEEGVSSSLDTQWVAVVIAHELAHQVFIFLFLNLTLKGKFKIRCYWIWVLHAYYFTVKVK